jgi:hypothetical protein
MAVKPVAKNRCKFRKPAQPKIVAATKVIAIVVQLITSSFSDAIHHARMPRNAATKKTETIKCVIRNCAFKMPQIGFLLSLFKNVGLQNQVEM